MKNILFFFALALSTSSLFAQQDETFKKAMEFKKQYNYKEAFPLFQTLIKADSNNVEYLAHGSQAYSRYGYFYVEKEKNKQTYYQTARYLAKKAIAINEKNAQAHYAYCLSLGRIYENAGNKEKIANAKLIKQEIDRTIELDPTIANAYHVLGRWNSAIANFTPFQKKMINKHYGGVPVGASFEQAINCYKKAIELAPNEILHYYEMAETYHEMKDEVQSKAWAAKALAMTPVTEEDKVNFEKAKKLK